MKRFFIVALVAVIFIVSANPTNGESPLLCYVATWAVGSYGKRLNYNDLDPNLCTHIVIAFAMLSNNKLMKFEPDDGDKYNQIVALKQKNPNLKVLLSVGGANMGAEPFRKLTRSGVDGLKRFATEVQNFLVAYKLDGLDIDWEAGPVDKKDFNSLLQQLRIMIENHTKTTGRRLLLTAALPAAVPKIAEYDVPTISQYLDFFNLMTYDFHGTWEREVGNHSPLFDAFNSTLTVSSSANEWVRRGAPKEKILIGVPAYGRSFTLVNAREHNTGAPASGPGKIGAISGEPGILFYSEICSITLRKSAPAIIGWDDKQRSSYAYWDNQWVGFDNERSIKEKVKWLKKEGFGGIMVWTLDEDDTQGSCNTGKFPLINIMKKELGN